MAFNPTLVPKETKNKVLNDIGNMIETNIHGCSPFWSNETGIPEKVSAIDSLRALHAFLNNENKHMKNLKKTTSSGGGAKDMESKATFEIYETFSTNLHIVLKAVNSMVEAVENDKSDKATDILGIVEGKRGILGSMLRKLLVVLTGEESRDENSHKLSPDDIRFVQELSFRKFRVEKCEQAMIRAFKNLNESGYDPEKIKEISISIISGSVGLILSETAYILKFDNH